MMAYLVPAEHTPALVHPAPVVTPTTQRRKPEWFPRPTLGVDETREHWNNFVLRWTQYKEDSGLKAAGISRQLVACCSEDLSLSLNRGASSLRRSRRPCSST